MRTSLPENASSQNDLFRLTATGAIQNESGRKMERVAQSLAKRRRKSTKGQAAVSVTPMRSLRLKKYLLLLFALAITIVGTVLWMNGAFKSDPIYHGKRLSLWIDNLATDDAQDSIKAWEKFGPDAAAGLIQALQRKDSPIKKAYLKFFPKLPLFVQRNLPIPIDSVSVRCDAIIVLGSMGVEVEPAIPALLIALKDEESSVRMDAAGDLGNIHIRMRRPSRFDK